MKQNKLIYAFIILGVTFLLIYVNKKIFLESYTYNNNLTFNKSPSELVPTGILKVLGDTQLNRDPPVHATTCQKQCDSTPTCTGFTTSIINTPEDSGVGSCILYNHAINDTRYLNGTNLYLK